MKGWSLLPLILTLAVSLGCTQHSQPVRAPGDPLENHAVEQLAQASQLAQSPGHDAEARQVLTVALEREPRLWEAHYNLGVLSAKAEDLETADHHLTQAAEMAPDAEDVTLALAEVKRRRRDTVAASALLERFLSRNSGAVQSQLLAIRLLRDNGQFDAALKRANALLQVRPRSPEVLSELALTLLARGNQDAAQLIVGEALRQSPGSAPVHQAAAQLALQQGDDAAAFRHFAQASALDPEDTAARLNIASLLLRAGICDRAVTEYRGVLQGHPQNSEARLGLAAALRGQGSRTHPEFFTEAEKELQTLLAGAPKNWAATFDLAVLYADSLKRPKDAKRLFQRFLSEAPAAHPKRAEVSRRLAALN